MKRVLVGALVGAIIIFAWQAVARMVFQYHNAGYKHAPNSEAILSAMSGIKEDGQYFLPDLNHEATAEEMEAQGKAMEGKPWAIVTYHRSWDTDMATPMIRQFATMFLVLALFIWILGKNTVGFSNIFIKTLATGFMIFLAAWYPQNIWFHHPWDVLQGELIDLLVGWGLVGLWLGWWLNRRTVTKY